MSTVLTELFRHSFPKGLRFCGQCKILHSNLTTMVKRNRNRRYIPKSEITNVMATFEDAPYPWMRNIVIRKLLMLGFVNQTRRAITKKPLWILSQPMHTEYYKLKAWLEAYEQGGAEKADAPNAMHERTTGSTSGAAAAVKTSTATADTSAASSTAPPTTPAGVKKGKWSASKYVKPKPAADPNVPTRSNKGDANSLFESSRGKAADLASQANKEAAPLSSSTSSTAADTTTTSTNTQQKASLMDQSRMAMNQVFGMGGASVGASPSSSTSPADAKANAAQKTGGFRSANINAKQQQGQQPQQNVNRNTKDFIEREVFERSFLGNFHVAMYYHLSFLGGMGLMLLCLLQLMSILYVYHYVYYSIRYSDPERGNTIAGLVDVHLGVEETHLTVEVPEEFKSQLPPPAVVMSQADAPKRRRPTADGTSGNATPATTRAIIDPRTGRPIDVLEGNNRSPNAGAEDVGVDGKSDVYVLNAVELTSADKKVRVVFLPSPVVGPESFFREEGEIMREADVLLLEGISLDYTHRQSANTFFPLHDSFFGPYGLSHRFYDILSSDREPPVLLPAATPLSWTRWVQLFIFPFTYVMMYNPMLMVGSKGEARVGWSWLVDALDTVAAEYTPAGPAGGGEGGIDGATTNDNAIKEDALGVMAPFGHEGLERKQGQAVVVVPWTVNQIANIEASLLRKGYSVTAVHPIRWMEVGQTGRAFAKYFGVTKGDCGPIVSAPAAAAADASQPKKE